MEDRRAHMGTSSFSHNGDYFALVSIDGRLRIWDTTSGKVVQEFSTNSAAQSSCTCLCWTRKTFTRGQKKKLKRKIKKQNKNEELLNGNSTLFQSIAVGTDKGYLFCYNPTTGEVNKLNKDGHLDKITCVVYDEKQDTLFTCSDDKFVVQWCYKSQQIKSKWKADKRAVKRICFGPSGSTLLSAGCSIKLWNVDTKELLQEFLGHSSPVSLLQISAYKQNVMEGKNDDGYYFISGSTEDRVINAWQINTKKPETTAVASFRISDIPIFMDVIVEESDELPLKLCVGGKDGRIQFFTCTMNGRASKPVESSKTVDYVTNEATPIPFINGRLYKNEDVYLKLVYGQILNLSFSNLCYDNLEITSKIEKDLKKNLLLNDATAENDISVELASTNTSSKFISDTSSSVFPAKAGKLKSVKTTLIPVNGDLQEAETSVDGMSMEERLKLTQFDTKEFVVKMKPKKATPSAGSFAQMLIQALHSNDEKLIRELLFNNSFAQKVLTCTIKRVPSSLVETLLRTITNMLLWNPSRSRQLILWIRTIMSVHLTFLLTSEVSRDALAGLYKLIKSQEEIHLPLMSLQGKIEMLCSYVAGINAENENDEDLSTAAVVYDDSDETEEPWGKVHKAKEESNEIFDSDDSEEEMDHLKNDSTNIESDDDNEIGEVMSEHSDQESEEDI